MCEQSQACISEIAVAFPMMTRMGQSSGLGGAAAMRRGPLPTPTLFSHRLMFLGDLCRLFLASVVGMPTFLACIRVIHSFSMKKSRIMRLLIFHVRSRMKPMSFDTSVQQAVDRFNGAV